MSYGSYFTYRIKPDMKTSKEMLVIGTGFQHLIDNYFWYLPFASVGRTSWNSPNFLNTSGWPNVLPWQQEHNTPRTCDSFKDGLKAWLQTDLFKQCQGKLVVLLKST